MDQCSVEGCEKPRRTRGWCQTHYSRWHRTGKLERTRDENAGRSCTADGCSSPAHSKLLCVAHYNRMATHGTLQTHIPVVSWSKLPAGAQCAVMDCERSPHGHGLCSRHYQHWRQHGDPTSKRIEVENYPKAHYQVRRAYGPASRHACIECGSLAAEWAYNHRDPDERIGYGNSPYSMDPQYYQPMCVPCHRRFDAGR